MRLTRKTRPVPPLWVAAFGAAVTSSGCQATAVSLQPAPSAPDVGEGPQVTGKYASGVKVTLDSTDWPGEVAIDIHVSPALVRVENQSGEPVMVRYGDFTLLGESGDVYRALPPFEVDGNAPRLARAYSEVSPTYESNGFEPAPMYAVVYPNMSPFTGEFGFGTEYYASTYERWRSLPTPEMLSWALPEGVVQHGGYVSGYLYFEKVDDDEGSVLFRAELKRPASNQPFAAVSLPLLVEE